MVYQHTSVLDDLTVAENLLYCVPPSRRAGIAERPVDRRTACRRRRHASTSAAGSAQLSVAERQLVEIAKALALQPKVLVLDEPTEALTAVETEQLFVQIASIKARGTAVVYISHRLPEVRRIADRISILRDGRFRGTFEAAGISEQEILALIIGRSIDRAFPPKGAPDAAATPVLVAGKITSRTLQGVDFAVQPGEVVGLAGVEGNGQREFLRTLAGLEPASGELTVRGAARGAFRPGPRPGRRHRLPARRSACRGAVPVAVDPREPDGAGARHAVALRLRLAPRARATLVEGQIEALSIKARSPEDGISHLSGGNQQKVLFARSLARDPAVLLADEPTRGVDAGARLELYRILRDIADKGAGVVVLSSDAVELQGLCDRVLVFSRGAVVRTLTGDEITEESITGAAIGAATARQTAADARQVRARPASGDSSPATMRRSSSWRH